MEKLYPEKMACVAIREEVEEKNKKIETTEDTLQTLKSQIKKDEKDLEIVANESMACNSIRESVLVLDNLQKECKVIERSVQDLEKKIGESGGLSDRSYEEVKTEEDLKTQGKVHYLVDRKFPISKVSFRDGGRSTNLGCTIMIDCLLFFFLLFMLAKIGGACVTSPIHPSSSLHDFMNCGSQKVFSSAKK